MVAWGQGGAAFVWVLAGLAALAIVGVGGYLLFFKPPPFEGVWKIEAQYEYSPTLKQWMDKPVASEAGSHLQFKDGLACQGALTSSGFTCVGGVNAYTVSGDVISLPGIATPMRLRWSITGDRLELVSESAPAGEWLPLERHVAVRVVEN